MKDAGPSGARASGRWLVALVALAFVAGLTLMGYAARNGARRTATAPAGPQDVTLTPRDVPAPTVVIPQQPPPGIDTTTLATREATLAGAIAALEARTAQLAIDSAAAGDQATRAEAVLVAAAARRQVDAGQPLGYLEEQLRRRFGGRQPRSVAVLIAATRQPTTLDRLVAGLDQLRPRLSVAPQDDFFDALRRELATLVILRRSGAPSPLPTDRFASARASLVAGQVDAARAVVAGLPGAPAAGAWLAATRRWVLAHQALDALDAAALSIAPATTAPVTLTPPATTTVLPTG